jgi:mRNA interferase MazF
MGHEIKKSRPAVVIQNDVGNTYSSVTIIAPITSQGVEKTYPFEVFLAQQQGLPKDSKVLLNQIRAVDKQRLVKKLGAVEGGVMMQVDDALKVSLSL